MSPYAFFHIFGARETRLNGFLSSVYEPSIDLNFRSAFFHMHYMAFVWTPVDWSPNHMRWLTVAYSHRGVTEIASIPLYARHSSE